MNKVRLFVGSAWSAFFFLGCGSTSSVDTPTTTDTTSNSSVSTTSSAVPTTGSSSTTGPTGGTGPVTTAPGPTATTGPAPTTGPSGSSGPAPTTSGPQVTTTDAPTTGPSGSSEPAGSSEPVDTSDEEPPPAPPQVVTSSDGQFWVTGTYTTGAAGNADVTVAESGNQPWDGFGGTFNEAGWDALSELSEADRALALQLLYDDADGANFVYGRLPIGASDYAMDRYTLNDTAGDTAMTNFSIERDKEKLIPYAKAALAVKPDIHLWSSPWTPPPWMKSNNSYDAVAGRTPPYAEADGFMKDDNATLEAFALYLEKYVQAYAAEGLNIRAIHPQNEPGYGNPYPSCYWTTATFQKFVRDFMGPRFEQNLPDVQIWAGTMSHQSDGQMALDIANDTAAMEFIDGFGLQWNTKNVITTLRGTGRRVMQTEHKCGNYNFNTDYWQQSQYDPAKPQNDYAYGVESWKNIRDWVRAGVNSYSAWNMVLDTLGANLNPTPWHQNALLVVDRNANTLIRTPAYYVFRHLSQYTEAGSTVVGVTGGDALAFKKDDRYTVVLYNEGAARQSVIAVGGEKLQVSLPANGWATVVYPN